MNYAGAIRTFESIDDCTKVIPTDPLKVGNVIDQSALLYGSTPIVLTVTLSALLLSEASWRVPEAQKRNDPRAYSCGPESRH